MRAGYNAYYAAYSTGYFGANHKPHRQSSPYSNKIQSKQWEKGWQFAQRNHENGKQFSYDPFIGINLGYLAYEPKDRQDKQRDAQRKQAEFKARQQPKRPAEPWKNTKNTAPAGPAVSLKRLDKFNKKYRTKV